MLKYFLTCTVVFCVFFSACSVKKEDLLLKDSANLNGQWLLEKMENKTLHVKTLKTIKIHFETKEKGFFGNEGCNEIFGNLKTLDEKNMQFNIIGRTRMYCENMKISDLYMELLKKVHSYYIKDNYLVLLDKHDKKLLIYKKSK